MVTAIILGAGFSRRFGKEKLLMEIDNKPIICHVTDIIASCDFHNIIMIYQNEEIKRVTSRANIQYVYNPNADRGMSTSVICGVNNSIETNGYMFFNGDQPLISKEIINKLLNAFYDNKGSIIAPTYNGIRGNPVIFHTKWKNELLNVTGDVGGRNIIKENTQEVFFIEMNKAKYGMDIDTWEDYIIVKEMLDK
ncbi:MAG: nucleotidyltransferase family protein [Vallitalea sp.]|jgi:molybdenum cofactor cytidylyltransferase|nr:nucleotidyltransferase family protein [Vallitalea sp.]